jgi:AraC-like DNA-binding protein
MPTEPTIAGSTFLSAFTALAEIGTDEAELEKEAGLAKEALEDPDVRVPVTVWNRFLETGRIWSKDPAFALHLGEKISHSRMSVVGHVVFNSRTAGEGIRQYIRFIKLANEGDRVALEESGQTVSVVYTTENPAYTSPLAMERNFALAVTRLRRYTRVNVSPVRVEFQHAEPDYVQEYHRVFQSDVVFNQDKNRLIFHRSVLDLKIGRRSAHLYSGLVRYAETLMGKLLRKRPVTRKARHWIIKLLNDEGLDIETVAQKMHMSRQTLYRKLKKEGTSFKELLDDTRKTLARQYIEQNDHSISEIAFFLGFSQISSFNRAFNRWYGRNPSEFRNQTDSNHNKRR